MKLLGPLLVSLLGGCVLTFFVVAPWWVLGAVAVGFTVVYAAVRLAARVL